MVKNIRTILYLYLLIFGYYASVGAQTPQEVLQTWKEQIEQKRQIIIEELQKKYDVDQDPETKKELDAWKTRTRLDHINITYKDDSKTYGVYIQLENSRRDHFLPIYYYYDEKEVVKSLENLMKVLTNDTEPEISLHLSSKIRFEEKWLLQNDYFNDLYTARIMIDYRKNKPPKIDWSKKN